MIPEGKYRALAQSAEFGTNDNGNDFCMVSFKLTDGELEGEHISAWLYFSTDKNTERSIESLRYCGCTFPGNDITNTEGLGSKECEIVVEHETWEGKTRAKVKWINSGGVGVKAEQKMTPVAKKSFAQRMKAKLVAGGGAPSSSPAAERVRSTVRNAFNDAPPPISEDDIPF